MTFEFSPVPQYDTENSIKDAYTNREERTDQEKVIDIFVLEGACTGTFLIEPYREHMWHRGKLESHRAPV